MLRQSMMHLFNCNTNYINVGWHIRRSKLKMQWLPLQTQFNDTAATSQRFFHSITVE